MQMQSDFSDIEVKRSSNAEATALGAAYLAGLAVGFFESRRAIKTQMGEGKSFSPKMDAEARSAAIKGWHRAVKACRVFGESEE